MTDPEDERPIRVMVYPDRRDVIVIYVPEDQELWLPRLASPFDRYEVAKRLGAVEIKAKVSESTPGRFRATFEELKREAKESDDARQREREAHSKVAFVFPRGETTATDRRRALITDKDKNDLEISALRAEIARMSHAPFEVVREKQRHLDKLKTVSLAIQVELGRLRKAYHAEQALKMTDRGGRFMRAAKQLLPDAVFREILVQAEQDERKDQETVQRGA